jgi:hypothetical protein
LSLGSNTFDLGESIRPVPSSIWGGINRSLEANKLFTKADWLILTAAFLSFLYSVSLWFGIGLSANKEAALFVGLWVPSILSAGNYVRQAARSRRDA